MSIYGLLISFSIVLGAGYCSKEAKYYCLDSEIGLDIVLYTVPLSVLFARLYYVLFRFSYYKENLVEIVRIWDGGLAIYGALIGGVLGLFLLSKRKKIRLPLLLDIVSPIVLLGQAIGRWGNFANKEAHGGLVGNSFFHFFPFSVYIDGMWFYATFFYESLWNVIGFWVLLLTRKKIKKQGYVFSLYILWYSMGRIFIEQLRTDSLMLSGVRISQALSILLFLSVIAFQSKRTSGKKFYLLLFLSSISAVISLYATALNNLVLLAAGWGINFFVFLLFLKFSKTNGEILCH